MPCSASSVSALLVVALSSVDLVYGAAQRESKTVLASSRSGDSTLAAATTHLSAWAHDLSLSMLTPLPLDAGVNCSANAFLVYSDDDCFKAHSIGPTSELTMCAQPSKRIADVPDPELMVLEELTIVGISGRGSVKMVLDMLDHASEELNCKQSLRFCACKSRLAPEAVLFTKAPQTQKSVKQDTIATAPSRCRSGAPLFAS